MYLHRTIYTPERKTSIALERVFWDSIDKISNGHWKQWVLEALEDKPADLGRGTYLRTLVHKAALSGKLQNEDKQ